MLVPAMGVAVTGTLVITTTMGITTTMAIGMVVVGAGAGRPLQSVLALAMEPAISGNPITLAAAIAPSALRRRMAGDGAASGCAVSFRRTALA